MHSELQVTSSVDRVIDDRVDSPVLKTGEVEEGRKMVRCFECWRTRVPPPWLVVCGALLVQVGLHDEDRFWSYLVACLFVVGIWPVPSGGEEVCIRGEG